MIIEQSLLLHYRAYAFQLKPHLHLKEAKYIVDGSSLGGYLCFENLGNQKNLNILLNFLGICILYFYHIEISEINESH